MVEFHGYEIQRDAECSETLASKSMMKFQCGIETNMEMQWNCIYNEVVKSEKRLLRESQ